MIVKVLFLFAIFFVGQNGVSAASLNDLQQLGLLEKSSDVAVQPRGVLQCIPHLLNVWHVVGDVIGALKQFNNIKDELSSAVEKCKKEQNVDAQQKCRQAAEQAAEKKTKDLYAEVQKILPRVFDLLNKFRICLFS